jgi:hypothetical protein
VFTGPVVKIIVGAQEMVFNVHKVLLCAESEYFAKCFQGNFAEATTGETKLPETDPKTFTNFVKWLYTGDMAPFARGADVMGDMVDAYILGDRLVCPNFQNRAIDLFQVAARVKPCDHSTIIRAVTNAPTESKLLLYLAKQITYEVSVQVYTTLVGSAEWREMISISVDFTNEVMLEMEAWARNKDTVRVDPSIEEGCRWHVHPDGKDRKCDRSPIPYATDDQLFGS